MKKLVLFVSLLAVTSEFIAVHCPIKPPTKKLISPLRSSNPPRR